MKLHNPTLLGVAVAAAISAVAIGITLVERVHTERNFEHQAFMNCVAIEDLKSAISDVLEDGRTRLVRRRSELDVVIYRDSLRYYDRQLSRFLPKEC